MAPARPECVLGRPNTSSGASSESQGGSAGDEFIRRDSISVSRRERCSGSSRTSTHVEVARLPRQIPPSAARRTLSAAGDRLAAQSDVPRPDGWLLRCGSASVPTLRVAAARARTHSERPDGSVRPGPAVADANAGGPISKAQKTVVQLGMVGVLASQLWYHTFIESLADLPAGWQRPPSPESAAASRSSTIDFSAGHKPGLTVR